LAALAAKRGMLPLNVVTALLGCADLTSVVVRMPSGLQSSSLKISSKEILGRKSILGKLLK
jgi:hypothetical protein